MTRLDQATASRFARLTLGHLGREYPHKLDHVLAGPGDARTPRDLHPIFFGSFDWHSCVHGWWQVMRLLRRFPDMPEAAEIRARADEMLVAEKVAGELAYLEQAPETFERPYGLAWLIALHGELAQHKQSPWSAATLPLSEEAQRRMRRYLLKLRYPIRDGAHANTGFSLLITLHHIIADGWSLKVMLRELEALFGAYRGDRAAQAWEPGGDSFVSPTLVQALLMSRVMEPGEFRGWFDDFLPEAAKRRPETLFTPAEVSDREDGKIVHLDGLNLSRAWCWRGLAEALGPDHPVHGPALEAAERHIAASLPHLDDSYMGGHWLATFALLALDGDR